MMNQPLNCNDIEKFLQTFSLVRSCDQVNGWLRMSLPFRYHNGSQIDLFLEAQADLTGSRVLTDMGHTVLYLLDLHVKPWATKKRKQVVDDVCQSLGVALKGGQLQTAILENEMRELSDPIIRLAQACVRVADLSFSQRFPVTNLFREDIEEFIENIDLPYESGVTITGRFGNSVDMDYRVHGRKLISLIKTISTNYPDSAHNLANEAFRCWYDLSGQNGHTEQFVSVINETPPVFRSDDLKRLQTVSQVILFPAEQDRLRDTISA